MAERSKKTQETGTKVKEFVTVVFAEDAEQAKEYQTLLESNDIPVKINEQIDQVSGEVSFAVMVAEDFVDEAYVVVESQDAYDDFYDSALEEDNDLDFDSNLFDDDI